MLAGWLVVVVVAVQSVETPPQVLFCVQLGTAWFSGDAIDKRKKAIQKDIAEALKAAEAEPEVEADTDREMERLFHASTMPARPASSDTTENTSESTGDTAATETSLLNWTAVGAQIANSITVPVDASRQIKVFCGDQTGSTHVIIDVFGYYL